MLNTKPAISKPHALKPGDVVRVVSPASPLQRSKVHDFERLMADAGFEVTYGAHAFDNDFYLAGDDWDRADDLLRAFTDPSVQCVFCSRGGYGCARLLPHLDLDRMAAAGKLFAGFSDITTLHLGLNRRGLATLHAPMALTLSVEREPWVYESLKNALTGKDPIPKEAPRGKTLVPGKVQGLITGGCLCLLSDSIGTANAFDAGDKIVLIEDVDENPHRIDAMLTHLILSGTIQKAAGIVVGEMTRTDEKVDEGIGGRPWREIVRDRLEHLGVPIITDFPFGHTKNMLSLPLGIRAELDADAGTLTYLESLCD